MTAQTMHHAGAVRPTPTASTTADLHAQLDATRAAARAALADDLPVTPETIAAAQEAVAAHYAAYAALHSIPMWRELAPVWCALAVMVGLVVMFWFVGGWQLALCAADGLLLWFALPFVLGHFAD